MQRATATAFSGGRPAYRSPWAARAAHAPVIPSETCFQMSDRPVHRSFRRLLAELIDHACGSRAARGRLGAPVRYDGCGARALPASAYRGRSALHSAMTRCCRQPSGARTDFPLRSCPSRACGHDSEKDADVRLRYVDLDIDAGLVRRQPYFHRLLSRG